MQRLIEGWRGFSQTVAMNPGMYQATLLRRVLAALGSALIYTHSQGVLHRDVKPSNVLLSRNTADIKLADFGISKLLAASGHAHTAVGTPYYLSPEIVSGEPYGPASDAWAVGVCLYELAALQRPFRAENQLALACQIAQQLPEPLPEGCAADIVQAVSGLLVKDPVERMKLPTAMTLLNEPQLLSSFCAEVDQPMPSHCCAIGIMSRPQAHPPSQNGHGSDQPAEKRSTGRRRWPRFRLGSRPRLSKVVAGHDTADTSNHSMRLVSSLCLAGHSLQQLSASAERQTCATCHQEVTLGSLLWCCRTCSFSICEACSQHEAEWKVIALDDVDDSM